MTGGRNLGRVIALSIGLGAGSGIVLGLFHVNGIWAGIAIGVVMGVAIGTGAFSATQNTKKRD